MQAAGFSEGRNSRMGRMQDFGRKAWSLMQAAGLHKKNLFCRRCPNPGSKRLGKRSLKELMRLAGGNTDCFADAVRLCNNEAR